MSVTKSIINEQNKIWLETGTMPNRCSVGVGVIKMLMLEYLLGEDGISFSDSFAFGKVGNMRLTKCYRLKPEQIIVHKLMDFDWGKL